MDTRVTLRSIVQGALADTQRLSAQLATLQEQTGTGKRFSQVSDDPTAVLTVLNNETQARRYETHLDNVRAADSRLNATVGALQQVSDLFAQAKSIAIEGASSVSNGASFEALAQTVDGLLSRLLSLANMQQEDGAYVFSGTGTRTEPFVVTAADIQGRPLGVQYVGTQVASRMIVDDNRQIAIDYPGDEVFQLRERQPTFFTGDTGARPGAGTNSASGRGELLIRHTATTYAAGSGVQPGTSSAAGDTILGPLGQHRLHITDTSGTGAAGTVSLNGGPPVSFTNADGNLAVTGPNGEVVYLDTTAITANFDGDVDIASDGTMSIDGGATSVPITFAADQSLIDPVTGKVTYVDTANVARTGRETVTHPGTFDAFQALMTLRDDLRNTRNLSEHDQIAAISGDLAELDRMHASVLNTVGSQSATLQSLQSLETHLEDLKLNAQKTASVFGDVDLSELVVKLQAHQNMLQLSLATFSRMVSQNLLDFLR